MLEHWLGSWEVLGGVYFPPLDTTCDWHVGTHMSFLFCLFSSLCGGDKEEKEKMENADKMKIWEGIFSV